MGTHTRGDIHGKENTRNRDYTEKGEGTHTERRYTRSGDTYGGEYTPGRTYMVRGLHGKGRGDTHVEEIHAE